MFNYYTDAQIIDILCTNYHRHLEADKEYSFEEFAEVIEEREPQSTQADIVLKSLRNCNGSILNEELTFTEE